VMTVHKGIIWNKICPAEGFVFCLKITKYRLPSKDNLARHGLLLLDPLVWSC
jgi:hypothetical protein